MESWRPAENRPLLEVTDLSKAFAGIVASDRISFNIGAGELHAVIGPNGTGKTTLVNQIAGQTLSDSGSIQFAGRDITRLPTHRRSRLGLARSFQITELFRDFNTIDNVALAVQAQAGHSFRFWHKARLEPQLRKPAVDAQSASGLRIVLIFLRLNSATASIAFLRLQSLWAVGRECSFLTNRWRDWAPKNQCA